MVLKEVGYGHQEPILFEEDPDKALQRAYELYLANDGESIIDSRQDCRTVDEFLEEGLTLPEVYEVLRQPNDEAAFRKAWSDLDAEQEAEKKRRDLQQEAVDRAAFERLKAKFEPES